MGAANILQNHVCQLFGNYASRDSFEKYCFFRRFEYREYGNRLRLKSLIQRTSQRVKRTSAARVRVSFGRSRARSFGRFAISLARSLDGLLDDLPIERLIARSLDVPVLQVQACTMIKVHACTMSIVHACNTFRVHSCTVINTYKAIVY